MDVCAAGRNLGPDAVASVLQTEPAPWLLLVAPEQRVCEGETKSLGVKAIAFSYGALSFHWPFKIKKQNRSA